MTICVLKRLWRSFAKNILLPLGIIAIILFTGVGVVHIGKWLVYFFPWLPTFLLGIGIAIGVCGISRVIVDSIKNAIEECKNDL